MKFTIKLWMMLLALGGMGITGYLTYEKLTSNLGSICGTGGCSLVLSSPYANIGVVPLTLVGFALYGLIFLLSAWGGLDQTLTSEQWLGLWVLTSSGVAFSGYLMSLLVWEIGAFCPFCLASALTLTILWLTMLTQKSSRSGRGVLISLACLSITALATVGLYHFQKNSAPPIPANFGIIRGKS